MNLDNGMLLGRSLTMKYYISDLHLFHEAAIRFDNRPFHDLCEMHRTIAERWNGKVTNGDFVYLLGDVSMRGKNEDLISLVATLKGKKVLIKGNHDDLSDYRYQQLFYEICDYKEIKDIYDGKNCDVILSHYPLFSWKKMGSGAIHLYGHTHNGPEDEYYQKCLSEMMQNDCRHAYHTEVKAINVGCMKPWMEYEPRTLQELMQH